MGMQCTAVDRPLSSKADGFVDEDLLGRYVDDEWEFILTADGDLEWRDSGSGGRALFHVWSTEIEGRRYLNFPINRPYECIGCDEDGLSQLLKEPEAIFALLYATDITSLEGPALSAQDDIAELERREGEWVAYSLMDNACSAQAIAMGLVEGKCNGPCRTSAEIRLTGSRSALQEFISQYNDQLYRSWNVGWRQQE
jgi:hypothetical protein